MKRLLIAVATLLALAVGYVLAHWALIETGREVIVLRTREPDGTWLETRLWIVDDGGFSWLHGANSRWMANLKARPLVELVRVGETRALRATVIPGPHPNIHERLRAKYGVADWWVRTVHPDDEHTAPVRLEPAAEPPS